MLECWFAAGTYEGEISLEKFIPLKKRSKKAQKAYYAEQRGLWSRAPQTQVIPSGKRYRRNWKQETDISGGM